MPSYVVGQIDVHDPETYMRYATVVGPLLKKFGGKFIVRNGKTYQVEGDPPASRIAIMEFPDAAAAKAWQNSPEYQGVVEYRRKSSVARVFIVDGIEEEPLS